MAAMKGEDVWTWLRSCRTCQLPHQWRWTCTRDHKHGSSGCEGGTWADPGDGHIYSIRLQGHILEDLQQEWESTRD